MSGFGHDYVKDQRDISDEKDEKQDEPHRIFSQKYCWRPISGHQQFAEAGRTKGFGSGSDFQSFCSWSSSKFGLGIFNQFLDALRIGFGVAMAADGIAAARGFDQDFGPNEAGFDVHRRNFRDAHAFLVHAEECAFAASDRLVAHLDVGGKEKVALGPAAGFESLDWHNVM